MIPLAEEQRVTRNALTCRVPTEIHNECVSRKFQKFPFPMYARKAESFSYAENRLRNVSSRMTSRYALRHA